MIVNADKAFSLSDRAQFSANSLQIEEDKLFFLLGFLFLFYESLLSMYVELIKPRLKRRIIYERIQEAIRKR